MYFSHKNSQMLLKRFSQFIQGKSASNSSDRSSMYRHATTIDNQKLIHVAVHLFSNKLT